MNLTEAGERFVLKAQGILAGVEEAVEELRHSPEDLSGRVRIGVTETISAYLIPMLVSSLSRHFPNLQIEMIERDRTSIEKGLLAQEFDLAFILVSNMEGRHELEYETMLRSPRRLWLHSENPLQYREGLTLGDIAQTDFILLDMDEHVSTVKRYWGARGLEPKVHFSSRSLEAVRSLVALGQGVTILSDLVYRPISLEGRRIIRRDLDDTLPTMDVGCVWKKQEPQPRVIGAVIDFIRRSISESG
ncbi:LysR substrate-binding domain-containing protein [Marinobacterium aestuariivivens]|uniref:LysR substrate-binding domain-containing protein n=1 Tax=Marinobacterium aestuariivivens TaxID=1698799 RepID=A0ABW1ZXU1_9GAMM